MQPSIDEWLKENLRYDPETGFLWWTKCSISKIIEKPAGSFYKTAGYIYVESCVEGVRYRCLAHRAAWFLYHGLWPKDQIDHINNDRTDNRIVNLREATNAENLRNMKIREGGTSQYKGVHWFRRDSKWEAQIRINKKSIFLGRYDTEEEAALAYNKAALEHFGEYAKINDVTP